MACYCGCATTGNKVKWGFLVAALVTGLALYIAGLCRGISNSKRYTGCMNNYLAAGLLSKEDYDKYIISDANAKTRTEIFGRTPNQYVNDCENRLMAGVWTMIGLVDGGLLLLVLALVPACMMCCCTRKPGRTVNGVPCVVEGRVKHEMVDVSAFKYNSCNYKDSMVAPPVDVNLPGIQALTDDQPLLEHKGE